MRKLIVVLVLCSCAGLWGCDTPKQKQSDAPAGHPDELKDSTRLDPAPEQRESDQAGPQ